MIDGAITVAVYASALNELEVSCVAKAGSNKLTIDGVTFHALTDAQYQQIVDAIELYLLRKRQREVSARAAGPAPEIPE